MAVAVLTEFPQSIVAGDTTCILLRNGSYPSGTWALKAYLRGPTGTVTTITASAEDNDDFAIVIPDNLDPGSYSYSLRFTETESGESITDGAGAFTLLPDPSKSITASIARRTLDAMEASLLVIAADTDATVSFNGQTYTGRNPKELQDAIARQRLIVSAEDRAIGLPSTGGAKRIVTRFT